jgi:acyl dehydratase
LLDISQDPSQNDRRRIWARYFENDMNKVSRMNSTSLPDRQQQYLEDLVVGRVIDLGSRIVLRDEIIAFARDFDPQPFHLDETAAEKSVMGGLCASGWHTAAIMMRLLCDGLLLSTDSRGSPGSEGVQFKEPLRPGDSLAARATVLEARVSGSRPEIGIVRLKIQGKNQHGRVVISLDSTIMVGRRQA